MIFEAKTKARQSQGHNILSLSCARGQGQSSRTLSLQKTNNTTPDNTANNAIHGRVSNTREPHSCDRLDVFQHIYT